MRKSFVKKPLLNTQMTLQITSMADIFMIILVFLLKSYGSGAIDVTPSPGLIIPRALTGSAPVEGLKLEIGEKTVRIDGEVAIAGIQDYKFKSEDLSANGASKALVSSLQRKKQEKTGSQVIVVADQRAPYSTIKAVLASAAVTGYTDFKLAVVNPN
ncbi:MAG TPA: biopolymer transporter ExbD [Bdellovibrionota bacterium]|nr:biopolymer transporter ExbD [Bdellovibrionota bacterium]